MPSINLGNMDNFFYKNISGMAGFEPRAAGSGSANTNHCAMPPPNFISQRFASQAVVVAQGSCNVLYLIVRSLVWILQRVLSITSSLKHVLWKMSNFTDIPWSKLEAWSFNRNKPFSTEWTATLSCSNYSFINLLIPQTAHLMFFFKAYLHCSN